MPRNLTGNYVVSSVIRPNLVQRQDVIRRGACPLSYYGDMEHQEAKHPRGDCGYAQPKLCYMPTVLAVFRKLDYQGRVFPPVPAARIVIT